MSKNDDSDIMVGCLAGLGVIVGFPLLIGSAVIVRAWLLMVLWGWFIIPLFGLHSLTIPLAVGLSCLVSYMNPEMSSIKDEYLNGSGWTRIASTYFGYGLTMLIAYIAHCNMVGG